MKIFLTGATGFIGSAVLTKLREAGHQVTAIVRSQEASLKVERAGAVGIIGDLFDPAWIAAELATHDAVIHTAAGGDQSDRHMNAALIDAAVNVLGGTDKPVVLTGGVWAHGSGDDLSESDELDPPELVAWRVDGERRLLESDVRATVIRPGIAYGHGGGIPALLTAQAAQDGPAPLFGTGQQHWTTVHVDDLADLYVAALGGRGGEAYLGVNGDNPTVLELAEALDTDVEPEGDEATRARLGAFGEALLLDQQATGAKARQQLGWSPTQPTLVEELGASYRA